MFNYYRYTFYIKYLKIFLPFILFLFVPITTFSQNLDIRILKSINSPNSLPSDKYFQLISNSAVFINIGAPLGLAVFALVKHDKETIINASTTAAASIICSGLTYAIKYTVNRKRPFETYPNLITKKSYGGDPSFPSSHTSAAFATATSLSIIYPKWYVIAPSYAWASVVAYSRMDLGVHYPSDVLAGIIVGMGTSYITFKAQKWLNNKPKSK